MLTIINEYFKSKAMVLFIQQARLNPNKRVYARRRVLGVVDRVTSAPLLRATGSPFSLWTRIAGVDFFALVGAFQ